MLVLLMVELNELTFKVFRLKSGEVSFYRSARCKIKVADRAFSL